MKKLISIFAALIFVGISYGQTYEKIYGDLKLIYGGQDITISQDATDSYLTSTITAPWEITTIGSLTFSDATVQTTAFTGTSSYWQRAATTLSPLTAGDNVSTTGYVNGGVYYIDGNIFADYSGGANPNLYVGYNNLTALTSGNRNTVYGHNAAAAITSASQNFIMGYNAGLIHTTGHYNVFVGYDSGKSSTTSEKNTCFGYNSGGGISTGKYNTCIGFSTGNNLGTQEGNVHIGYTAGSNSTASNLLFIDNSNTATPLIYGDFSTDHITINGSLEVTEANFRNVTTVNAATYDLLTTDYILHVTYTATGAVTSLTLPTAQVVDGRIIIIKDAGNNAGTNNITIDTEGGQTIDGSATLVLNGNGDSVMLYCNSSNWFILY